MKHLSYPLLFLLICQCSTTPERPKKIYLPKSQSSYQDQSRIDSRYNDIDLNDLFYELQMDQPIERIGYQERVFDTCEVKANKSENPKCERLYVSRLNYHVMCRDSTGTVERVQLRPLSHKKLRWKSSRKRGFSSTNSKGYGSLGFITRSPASSSHLYFYLGSKIARKKFRDKWKLVLPKSWCDHQ